MWRWHLMSAVSAWAAWQHCTIHTKYSMLKKKTLCLAQQIFIDGCMNQIKIWLPDSNQKILVPLNSRLMWLLSNTNFSRANSNWIPLDKSANIGLVNKVYKYFKWPRERGRAKCANSRRKCRKIAPNGRNYVKLCMQGCFVRYYGFLVNLRSPSLYWGQTSFLHFWTLQCKKKHYL